MRRVRQAATLKIRCDAMRCVVRALLGVCAQGFGECLSVSADAARCLGTNQGWWAKWVAFSRIRIANADASRTWR